MTRILFAMFSIAIMVMVAAFAYEEVAPEWKHFQREFHRLEVQKLSQNLQEARAKLNGPEAQARRRKAEQRYRKELERFQSSAVAAKYNEVGNNIGNINQQLDVLQDELRRNRARQQELETRPPTNEVKRESASLDTTIASLTKKIKVLNQHLAELLLRRQEMATPLEKAKAELDALGSDLEKSERALTAARKKGLKLDQASLVELQRADRCQTCHQGIDNPSFNGATQPFASHNPLHVIKHHPAEKFGCTVCHEGEGRATTVRGAHTPASGLGGLLPVAHVEATCRKCHAEKVALPGLPFIPADRSLERGATLFRESGCFGCHDVAAFGNEPKIGPPLARIGEKVNPSWLVRWLKNPKEYLPATRMPNFHLHDEEIAALASYLMTLASGVRGSVPAPTNNSDKGKQLFQDSRCVTCHALSGEGGKIGPDLARVGSKVKPEWIPEFLRAPRDYNPLTRMSRYRFTPEERSALASYLSTELVDFSPPRLKVTPDPSDLKLVERGRALVGELGCYGCHEIPGFERRGKVGADLNGFGRKPVERLDFGAIGTPRDRISWIRVKLKFPRAFRPTLKMPDFRFTDDETGDLTTFLLSLDDRETPLSMRAPADRKPSPEFAGAFGNLLKDVNCLVCHSIGGRGGTLAPDLSFEGSRASEDWLKKFLKQPDTIRPQLVERMPKFNFTDEEVRVLRNTIETVLVNDEIPATSSGLTGQNSLAMNGKRLYEAHGCRACHQVGMQGGAIGPNLTASARRLKFGYTQAWLENPQRWIPSAIEPNHGFSEAEAQALAAYIASLK